MNIHNIINKQVIYNGSPRFIKHILVNVEAFRRDRYRRFGNYHSIVNHYDCNYMYSPLSEQISFQINKLNEIVANARKTVLHYKHNIDDKILLDSIYDIAQLPILTKEFLKSNSKAHITENLKNSKLLWHDKTSGSTGTPLDIFLSRSTVRNHYAIADAVLKWHGCDISKRHIRISGVFVVPYSKKNPPFWIFIKYYNQLQASAYHISIDTFRLYLDEMDITGIEYGTGYASAWYLLATYILDAGITPPSIKVIITDSEGLTLQKQSIISNAFNCHVFQTYGTAELGQVCLQCSEGRYHVLTRSSFVEILDDSLKPVKYGGTGNIIVTDLTSFESPIIRYNTGDLAIPAPDDCTCGLHSPSWYSMVGRLDDYIITPEGRTIGRLSHIVKPGIGVRESQIIQEQTDKIVIMIVPDNNFQLKTLEIIKNEATKYLGSSMKVDCIVVNHIEREKSGKLRHVIRKINS